MERTGRKIGLLQGTDKETSLFDVWPFRLFFLAMEFHLLLRRKNQNQSTCNASQSQDSGVLEDLFAPCRETWVPLDIYFLSNFLEVWQKCTKFIPVQPGPSLTRVDSAALSLNPPYSTVNTCISIFLALLLFSL